MKHVDLNIDKIITLILPVLGISLLLFMDDKPLYLSLYLISALIFYELIIYKHRYVYGFSGLINLSIPSLVFFSFTVFIAIPGVYIASISNHPAVFPYFFSILAFYIILPFGLLIGNILYPININKVLKLKDSSFRKDSIDSVIYEILLIMMVIIGLIIVLYFLRVDKIPLVEMIKNPGEYVKLKILREEALKVLEVTFIERYLFNWVRSLFLPLCIISSLFLATVYKYRRYRFLFAIYFIIGIIFNSLTLEKSPAAAIILSLMAILFLRKTKIRFSFILISVVLVFLIPIAIMYFLQFGQENAWSIVVISLLLRIFIVPTESLYYYFLIFPNTHDYLYGRSTHLFSWLHSGGIFNTPNYIAKVIWNIPDTTGSVNVNFIGNFWADFGYTGVVVSIFFVGIIIHLIYSKLLSICEYRKDIIYTSIICSTTAIFTFSFFSSNFTILLVSRGLFFIILFLAIYKKFYRQFVLKY